jgi:hypothetical protein
MADAILLAFPRLRKLPYLFERTRRVLTCRWHKGLDGRLTMVWTPKSD